MGKNAKGGTVNAVAVQVINRHIAELKQSIDGYEKHNRHIEHKARKHPRLISATIDTYEEVIQVELLVGILRELRNPQARLL